MRGASAQGADVAIGGGIPAYAGMTGREGAAALSAMGQIAHDPAIAASSALLAPFSGAYQGLSPLTDAIRPYPSVACASQPIRAPQVAPIALNNASASFLINPMHRACQYPYPLSTSQRPAQQAHEPSTAARSASAASAEAPPDTCYRCMIRSFTPLARNRSRLSFDSYALSVYTPARRSARVDCEA